MMMYTTLLIHVVTEEGRLFFPQCPSVGQLMMFTSTSFAGQLILFTSTSFAGPLTLTSFAGQLILFTSVALAQLCANSAPKSAGSGPFTSSFPVAFTVSPAAASGVSSLSYGKTII